MNSFRCSNCSLLNFDTASACKRCGLPFDSGAEQADEPQHYAPEQHSPQDYTQPAEGNSYFWDQPNYQPSYIPPRPAPAPSGSAGKIVGVVVLLAVISLGAFIGIPKLLGRKTVNPASLSWREYKSPDGSFTVSLPGEPKELQLDQPTPAGTAKVRAVITEIGRDGGCMVMYAEYPQLSKVSEDMLYEQTLKNMDSRGGSARATLGNRKFITHDGHRGLEVEFKPKGPEGADAAGRARLFIVTPRVYVVMAGAPETPEFAPVIDKCLDSFKFNYGQ